MTVQTDETIRVLLVDDHDVVIRGLRSYLQEDETIEFVGARSRGEDVEEAVRELAPHVVIVDLRLYGSQIDGLEIVRRLRAAHGDRLKILVNSAYFDDALVLQVFKAGINGYLIKTNAHQSDVIGAIHSVMAGRDQYDPEISSILRAYTPAASQVMNNTEPLPGQELTAREWDVLEALAKEEKVSDQEIAETLMIATATVKTHLTHIRDKLGCPTRHEAARWYRLNHQYQPGRTN